MRNAAPEIDRILEMLLARGGSGLDERVASLADLRGQGTPTSLAIDRALVRRLGDQHRALEHARAIQVDLEGILAKLTALPWFPAIFLGAVPGAGSPRALVRQGAAPRVVGFAPEVDPASVAVGDRVFLSRELNVIMAVAPRALGESGEVGTFERRLPSGRLLVRSREDQLVVQPAAGLESATLTPGTLLRFERDAAIAYETIEPGTASSYFVEDTPTETFADIGGLGPQLGRLTEALSFHFEHAGLARRYGLPPVSSILLHGAPGTGKTLIARAVANWFAARSPAGRSFFMAIKPAALESMWYGESERSIRELFRAARETAARHLGARVLIFFDELDAIGVTRGHSHQRIHDSMLTALLAELDGFQAREGVVVIGATNRRHALDPALLRPGRFGDLELEIGRPSRSAAREILGLHLGPTLPYARNGHGDDLAATRAEILDAAVARIYAPNGENLLGTLTFRDGRKRPVRAAELVSGAVMAGIAREAVRRACRREGAGGGAGIVWEDVAQSIDERFAGALGALTPQNARHHLDGLPHDLDVVNVEPAARPSVRPQRFLRVG